MSSNEILVRNAEYDKLRAVGIVLVVLGHTLGISRGFELYIYSFHMPLFFFLPGLMLKPERLALSLTAVIRHYAYRLLIPYFFFSLITYLPWVFITRYRGADAALNIPAWKPVIGTLYGVGINGWLQHNAMLWFFPSLFLVHILFHQLHNRLRSYSLLVLVFSCATLGYLMSIYMPFRLPWGAEAALVSIPFYTAGFALSERGTTKLKPGFYMATGVFILALLQLVCVTTNGRTDMNFLVFENPLLFYLGAFAGIGALVGGVLFLPSYLIFSRIADASILVFSLHRPIFSVITGVGLVLSVDMHALKATVSGSIVYTSLAIAVSIAVWPFARRYLPMLVGGR